VAAGLARDNTALTGTAPAHVNATAMTTPLSITAREFLHTRVRSVLHLHVLLMLPREAGRWCSIESIASRLRISAEAVGRALEDLGRRNLVNVKLGTDLLYRCEPVNADLLHLIEEIRAAHFDDPALVENTFGHRRSSSAARAFADAFRLRGRDVDG
jgi:hypothetical protein